MRPAKPAVCHPTSVWSTIVAGLTIHNSSAPPERSVRNVVSLKEIYNYALFTTLATLTVTCWDARLDLELTMTPNQLLVYITH